MDKVKDCSTDALVEGQVDELNVDLGDRSYPIHIGVGLLDSEKLYQHALTGEQALVVTNTTIASIYLDRVLKSLERCSNLTQIDHCILPDGEMFKSIETVQKIYDCLLENHHSRTTTLIALGGGVVGDMVGFAAATYQRGVSFIQVPTTLLAQVDSSVGGKTGVNHSKGKNMIGAFHQPSAVVIDLGTIQSLASREYQAGIAEVIKYGLIWDGDFFKWLENNASALKQRDPKILRIAVKRSCKVKAEIVRQDEREGGLRAILNLGHTFGHAIETATQYKILLHGEAVSIGMVMAVKLSARMGWVDSSLIKRVVDLLETFSLPTHRPKSVTPEQMKAFMMLDKKVFNRTLRLILLKGCGNAVITSDLQPNAFNDVLNEIS